ncbi:MAG: hypothetical protein E7Z64_04385 [Thermoplasmata archaeon]|nr:hypothetical protein [Thermoplasmata archaeon]
MTGELIVNRLFSERNTPEIIIHLFMFGPKTRTEIYEAISRNPRMPIKIDMLLSYRILKEHPRGRGQYTTLELTALGERFARMLCEQERLLGGSVDAYRWGCVMSKLEEFDSAAT